MVSLPDVPCVVAGHGRAALLSTEGELLTLGTDAAAELLRGPGAGFGFAPPLLVHAPATLRRLGLRPGPAFDLLELFAFVLPARPVAPTPRGLALALDLPPPTGLEAACALLPEIAATLLHRLAAGRDLAINRDAAALAACMAYGPRARPGARGGTRPGTSPGTRPGTRRGSAPGPGLDGAPGRSPDAAGNAGDGANTDAGRDAQRLAAPSLRQASGPASAWPWAPYVMAALGQPEAAPSAEALRVWRRLPEWEEVAPPPPPASLPVSESEARARLAALLGPQAEQRPAQADYAAAAASAFAPRERAGDPALVLAEAGTGTGKTLGYVAPASLWAERNGGAVWLSTYTRHLQRQIEAELARLHPDPAERRRRVVIRKGRENYLCLLNMEDAANAALSGPGGSAIVPLGLLSRWALATADGDLAGGDLPGWFGELFGQGNAQGLADRRGECIHGACPHYRRCYVEHTIRRARTAELVVANHALVMTQAAWGGLDDATVPTRYVFDEGHHVFDAADSAFSAELSGLEAAELRRWLLGAEGGRSRARGLRRRLDEMVAGQPGLEAPMDALLLAARALPAPGWSLRLSDAASPPLPEAGAAASEEGAGIANPTEAFLHALRTQILARLAGQPGSGQTGAGQTGAGQTGAGQTGTDEPGRGGPPWPHAPELAREPDRVPGTGSDARPAAPARFVPARTECDLHPVSPELAEAALRLGRALARIAEPLHTLRERLAARLEEEADTLEPATRGRIEALVRTLRRRAEGRLAAWQAMLRACADPLPAPGERPQHVHLLQLERLPVPAQGRLAVPGTAPRRDHDVALRRHWLDPTIPFATTLAAPAHGVLVTSATLRDTGTADAEAAWAAAEGRVGASHLPSPALRIAVPSPFDYAAQTRTFVVSDLAPNDLGALAGAYRALFLAAGGGGLGLFTAIARLRAVHARIAAPLEEAGIPLLAQHVDAMDNATLVDVFRTEEASCLLGTDAMRDGVDVPGRALRLVVFERVPWPRPDILHRERRIHLSGGDTTGFDDRIARLRLRQAFGRLIRSATDRGVFVLLDRRTPSRLLSAFPSGVAARRVGLAAAVAETGAFLEE